MEEIEVKFLNINKDIIEKKLENIGAKKVGEFFQRWKSFDHPDWRLDKECAWLRLRDEGDGKITLTFKKRLGIKNRDGSENDDGMEEIENYVSDFEKTSLMLEKIGLVEKHYAEKKRTSWEKDDIKFDLDTYPKIKPYLEIEATSWGKIDEAIGLLELNPNDKKIFSANQVYSAEDIDVKKLERITFAEGIIFRK